MWCCGIGLGHWASRSDSVLPRWSPNSTSAGEPTTSGNRAFNQYRTETLRRLEAEQREFQVFLDRLRAAKDKADFEQFMAATQPQSEGRPS